MTALINACPACSSTELELVASEAGIPVNSCLLLDSRSEAEDFPRGEMALTLCQTCAFVFNAGFDPTLSEYSARYEESQGYSAEFVEFARGLAQRWVTDYDLTGRTVLEIGCGSMGEFLQFMVEAGAGRGIGIDPALQADRIATSYPERFEWIDEFYPSTKVPLQVDAIVCRHTLEHIAPVREFMQMIRSAIGDHTETIVLFEIPDVRRVLEEIAFWDIYYEHCSYFSLGSLARLFRETGFEPVRLGLEYDDQYLVIEARPSSIPGTGQPLPLEADLDALIGGADHYRCGRESLLAKWQQDLAELSSAGNKIVIWGAGSKGVSFLSGLGSTDIEYAVDINPTKHGYFMAGTGHEIVGPEFLTDYQPDVVVVMNPIYMAEIQGELDRLGVAARLVPV